MASIFTRIINGEIPCYKLAEDDRYLAFLDIFPLAKGHVLVVPKQEVDYIFDLDDDLFAGLHLFAKKIARAMDAVLDCERVGVAVIGLEVPHAHIHLVPLADKYDVIDFSRPKLKMAPEEFEAIAQSIAAGIR